MNNKKTRYIIIGIVASLVLTVGGFIVYGKVLNRNTGNNKTTNTKSNKELTLEERINQDKDLKKAYNLIATFDNLTMDDGYYWDIYRMQPNQKSNVNDQTLAFRITHALAAYKEKVEIKELEVSKDNLYYKDYLNLKNENYTDSMEDYNKYLEEYKTYKITEIKEENVKAIYEQYYGKNAYQRSEFYYGCFTPYKWSEDRQSYIYIAIGCGDAMGPNRPIVVTTDVEKTNDKITIYQQVFNIKINETENTYEYYSDIYDTNLLYSGTVNDELYAKDDEFINKYSEKISLYKFNFINNDGIYVFDNVERIR